VSNSASAAPANITAKGSERPIETGLRSTPRIASPLLGRRFVFDPVLVHKWPSAGLDADYSSQGGHRGTPLRTGDDRRSRRLAAGRTSHGGGRCSPGPSPGKRTLYARRARAREESPSGTSRDSGSRSCRPWSWGARRQSVKGWLLTSAWRWCLATPSGRAIRASSESAWSGVAGLATCSSSIRPAAARRCGGEVPGIPVGSARRGLRQVEDERVPAASP
jgi:hypothetical protein